MMKQKSSTQTNVSVADLQLVLQQLRTMSASFSFNSSSSSTGSSAMTQSPYGPYSPPPFYFVQRSAFLPPAWSISDSTLSLAAPIIAYWSFSLFFHILDVLAPTYPSINKYKLHESAEVTKRNLATKWDVVKAVLGQQVVQTALGWYWMAAPDSELSFYTGGSKAYEDAMRWWGRWVVYCFSNVLGQSTTQHILSSTGAHLVWWLYWYISPITQFLLAMFIIDTHQYILHRSMHINKFLYKRIHSVHHRLYVPYAFGALYNHPIEGFLLDTLGAALAHALTGMTTRQAALLFAVATFKTVDDHCGYALPWDPLQVCFGNNADYHDIHHQVRFLNPHVKLYLQSNLI